MTACIMFEIELDDLRERIEIPVQDGAAAKFQATRGVGYAGSLKGTGTGKRVPLCGARGLVRVADNGHAVCQSPVLRWGDGGGE